MLSRYNDQQCLWWLLEQHQWTVGDLIRFAKYTELLSEVDASLLIKLNHRMEALIKKGRQEHALQKDSRKVLPAAGSSADDLDPEHP